MWPSTFSRYILREVLGLTMIMLISSTMIIMLGVVGQQLMKAGVGIKTFLQMLPYAIVISLQFAVPSSLLFAVCSVYGRMAADNELTAVKGAGVHPLRAILPVYVLGLLISPFVVWLNDVAVAWGRPGLNRIVLHSIEEIAYGVLRSNGEYRANNLQIRVEDVKDRWLIHPTIFLFVGPDTNTIVAEKASISMNEKTEKLVIDLVNWRMENGKHWQMYGGKDPNRFEIPLSMAATKGQAVNASSSELALSEMPVARANLNRETNTFEQALMSRSSTSMLTGQFGMFEDPVTSEHRNSLKDVGKRSFRLQQEPWRRWALGFSCLSFVVIGAPLAIVGRSANYSTSFAICFLPILIFYYPLFAAGVDFAKNGAWPSYSPFLANILTMAVGMFFLRKVYRS